MEALLIVLAALPLNTEARVSSFLNGTLSTIGWLTTAITISANGLVRILHEPIGTY